MKQTLLLLVILLLTSCLVGPNYVRPKVLAPGQFKEAKGKAFTIVKKKNWKKARPCDLCERGDWWRIFHDSKLNALEIELSRCNQSIVNALNNYCQARAIVDEARASLYPNLATGFSFFQASKEGASAVFSSSTIGTAPTGTGATNSASTSVITTIYSAILTANWEPDIWGQVRRTIEADAAAAQSSQALLAATRLSAQGSLAQYYFELRALDKDQELLDKTVVSYRKTLQLTRNQYASGVVSQADVIQAQSQLEVAEAQAISNGILRGQYEHAIAVLIGRPPACFSLPYNPLNAKPPVIPVLVPSALLERRPDIAQAERLMQQTNAQIGVAIAAYFPTLDLTATVSASANSLAKLFSSPMIGWAIGGELAENLFDGGLREATVRAAQSAYLAQVAAYRQVVLSAFQDVEDNLIALRILEKEGVVLKKAAADAEKALRLVINQYKAGTVPFSSVITAQIAAYTAEKNAYDVVGMQMTAAVGLIKALGGGWSVQRIACV
jgi:NodT family efflux transporter outer membrane factor (OMF) lipoprotein